MTIFRFQIITIGTTKYSLQTHPNCCKHAVLDQRKTWTHHKWKVLPVSTLAKPKDPNLLVSTWACCHHAPHHFWKPIPVEAETSAWWVFALAGEGEESCSTKEHQKTPYYDDKNFWHRTSCHPWNGHMPKIRTTSRNGAAAQNVNRQCKATNARHDQSHQENLMVRRNDSGLNRRHRVSCGDRTAKFLLDRR